VRVAVISDTHMPRGTRALPPACVERLAAADLILHAGDLTALSFLAELQAIGPPVEAVHGNMDEPALQALLPTERVVELGEARIGVVHIPGPRPGREARLAARFPHCDAVVYGHTHMPQLDQAGGVWILNPGSPTERRSAPARTMLELAVSGRTIRPELVTFDP
jgi:putative phosphoesterase